MLSVWYPALISRVCFGAGVPRVDLSVKRRRRCSGGSGDGRELRGPNRREAVIIMTLVCGDEKETGCAALKQNISPMKGWGAGPDHSKLTGGPKRGLGAICGPLSDS